MPSYYDVLQVAPGAEPDVIQAAYKRLAFRHHPDRNPDPAALETMKLLNEAYAVLSDPERRRLYDEQLRQPEAVSPPPTGGPEGAVPAPQWTPPLVPPLHPGAVLLLFACALPLALYGLVTLCGLTSVASAAGTLSATLFVILNWRQVEPGWSYFSGKGGYGGLFWAAVGGSVLCHWLGFGWLWGLALGLPPLLLLIAADASQRYQAEPPALGRVWRALAPWRAYVVAVLAVLSGGLLATKPAAPFLEQAEALAQQGDLPGALAACTEAIRREPTSALAHAQRAALHHFRKDYTQAVADYTEAIRLDPALVRAHHGRGHVHFATKDYDRAVADYTAAIRLNAKAARLYCDRGNAHLQKQAYGEAVADYTEALRLNPKDAAAYAWRGYAFLQKKEYDKAAADYTVAAGLGAADTWTYNNRGVAHEALGNADQALADYTEAIQLAPTNAKAYQNRARVLRVKGRHAEAEADRARAIALDPLLAKP